MSNTTFCCLPCRRIFRKPSQDRLPAYHCTSCARVLIHAGMDFKAPRATDRKGWATAERHLLAGHVYYRGMPPPETAELKQRRSVPALKRASRSASVFDKPKRKRVRG